MYLYHYYEKKKGPFRNLSSLDADKANDILKQLKEDKSLFASQRSDDYLFIRRELENKVREIFIGKGGKPGLSFPHYMTLGSCEWLKSWYNEGTELKIPLSEFDERQLSFTYGDLFPTMRFNDGKIYRGQVYTRSEILRLIDEIGFPQEWNPDGEKGPERYIEVQVWDEDIVKKYSGSIH